MSGVRCAICRGGSVMQQQADAVIRAAQPNTTIAATIGVSRHTVDRHVKGGHVAPALPGSTSAPLPSGASPLDIIQRVVDDLAAVDTSAMSPAARSAHFDNLRRAAESLARVRPPDAPSTVSVNDVDGLPEFFADLMTLVDRFPQTRPAMIDMTRRLFPMEGT